MTGLRLVVRWRLALAAVLAIVVIMASGSPAGAHPLGNFTVNRHIGVLVRSDQIELDYLVDLAEIPTTQLGADIDADVPGYCAAQAAGLALSSGPNAADAVLVAVETVSSTATRQPGEAGLDTMRVECRLVADVALAAGGSHIELLDRNDTDRIGWREIVVLGDRTSIDGDVTDTSPSARLSQYPTGDLAAAPHQTQVAFEATPSGGVAAASLDRATSAGRGSFGTDAFATLFANAGTGALATIAAFGVAILLGALHAMAPGHGKAVIGAYLVGTRGTRRQALVLAIAVALSHTLGVLVLGGVTLAAGSVFSPERVFPWLQGVSALIVLGIGIWLTLTWLGQRRAEHEHDHDHEHPHEHDHDDAPALVGAVAGRVHHDHPHPEHGHSRRDSSPRRFEVHRHGIFPHVHRHDLDQLSLEDAVSWRTLALLGLSGGLVPSTSAIIVLLGAVQIGRIAFGGALILAFGVGMSAALVGVGLGVVALSNRTVGLLDGTGFAQRARNVVAPAAAFAVLLIGVLLSARALSGIV